MSSLMVTASRTVSGLRQQVWHRGRYLARLTYIVLGLAMKFDVH
jgi:hypothetical protein